MRRFLAVCVISLALPAWADGPSPVKVAELSARAYAAGMAAGDPLLVLSAAKLRKGMAPVAGDRLALGATPGQGAPLGWEEMLASAAQLAEGDEAVLGLIEDARVETTKGVASGPVYNIGSLGNGKGDTYPPIEFRGGEYAEVYVEAKAAANLNLRIYDDKGRLVCSDTDISHIAYCGWTPANAGTFTLEVENKGPSAADYALMTN
ncbi:MAG: hypothetical protein U1E69_01905 [Tabrizicola sp.]|uniref:hypothetical protein n=1 Tax=Tabrizicola sp. TaxID=2005166 RepID=UPI002AB82D5F|nr:hypothetical protein [Tabrizicola sp.]MDZ4085533.1 hypothetical protein [Tabrizicola sp.]